MNVENIKKEAASAVSELVSEAGLVAGNIFVIGCSSSEIVGEKI